MAAQATHTFQIFYCYAHEDDALREQLARHLSPLRRLRYITGWFDRDIRAGTNWERESQARLDTANIILLLISADFMASDYCYTIEMQRALEKHRAGTAHVIPILLRPVEWERTPIGELSALPTDKKPITQWEDKDAAWLNVVQGINEIITKLLQQQQHSLEEANILYPEQGPLSGQTAGSKYLLGELIGEGGFSQVYKAQHLQLQRQQAIKVLLERHFRKREFRDRFLREAQTVASLDHPNIIHLDDFWVEAAQACLVMPFISEGTLQDVLEKQQGFLEQQQVAFYLEQICSALAYAHEKGVVHLDVKPQNLLIRKDDQLLLSDFGLAHLMKEGAIEGGSSLRVGTPHYMAPEHIRGVPERRSDLFSLGVILYQMLLGRLPFDGLSHETIILKNITEWPPAPRVLRPELPQSVEDMLAKALAKQPDSRYQTANEFLTAFKKAITLSGQPQPSTQKPKLPEWLVETALENQPTRVFPVLRQDESFSQFQPFLSMKKELPFTASIYVEEGKETGRVYGIWKESLSIGRSRENDIFLEDLAVSRLHASVVNLGNGNYALKDEGSGHGSKVNGQFVNKFQTYPLQEGDHIQLGQSVLVFKRDKKDEDAEPNVPASLLGIAAYVQSPQASSGMGFVRIEEGKSRGQVYEIGKESLSIGRSRESDIFLEDLAVSRLHASVVNLRNGNYALKDEGGANGSKVNGQLINRFQTYPLQEGDRIQIGQTVMVFFRR